VVNVAESTGGGDHGSATAKIRKWWVLSLRLKKKKGPTRTTNGAKWRPPNRERRVNGRSQTIPRRTEKVCKSLIRLGKKMAGSFEKKDDSKKVAIYAMVRR